MKKVLPYIFKAIFLLCMSSLSYAHYDEYVRNIKEGFIEIVKAPLPMVDIVKEETSAAKFKPFGVLGGLMKGSFYLVGDITSGIFRILTFNVENDNIFLNLIKR